MKHIALFFVLASAAMAGDVTYPVPRKSALVTSQPFDRMNRENVGVTAKVTGRSVDSGASGSKSLEVSTTGNGFGLVTVECLFVVEAAPETRLAGQQRILSAGQGTTDKAADTFEFVMKTSGSASKLKGWCVRVVKNGVIVGVAGSSPKFEEMAADPKTQVRYGEI